MRVEVAGVRIEGGHVRARHRDLVRAPIEPEEEPELVARDMQTFFGGLTR